MGNGNGSGGSGNSGALEPKIDAIAREVAEVKVLVAGMMPRAEVDAEIGKRVLQETYLSDQVAMKERITRLEASPMRLIAYLGAASGCLGVLVSVLMAMIYLTGLVIVHYKP